MLNVDGCKCESVGIVGLQEVTVCSLLVVTALEVMLLRVQLL